MNETTTANRSAAEATVCDLYGRLMDASDQGYYSLSLLARL
jgi:hypothetical protein